MNKNNVNFIENGKGIVELNLFNGYLQKKNKIEIPQYLHIRCGMTHLNFSLTKLGKTFKLQKQLLKTDMKPDEFYENTWKTKRENWLPYVINDVLSTAFS